VTNDTHFSTGSVCTYSNPNPCSVGTLLSLGPTSTPSISYTTTLNGEQGNTFEGSVQGIATTRTLGVYAFGDLTDPVSSKGEAVAYAYAVDTLMPFFPMDPSQTSSLYFTASLGWKAALPWYQEVPRVARACGHTIVSGIPE